jgi:hypothetical protein
MAAEGPVRMSEEGMPTYSAGDTVRMCVKVKPWTGGKGIRRIRAVFAHEVDPTKKLGISDDPERGSDAQVQSEAEIELRGPIIADAHPVGNCRLEDMIAEYLGGRTVRLAGAPDAALRVAEEEIKSPEVVAWRWL